VHGSGVLDYAVASVTKRETERPAPGIFGPPGEEYGLHRGRAIRPAVRGRLPERVRLRRLGDVRSPVTYRLAFASGGPETRVWDALPVAESLEAAPEALVSVTIDPDDAIALDADFNNNARTVTADPGRPSSGGPGSSRGANRSSTSTRNGVTHE